MPKFEPSDYGKFRKIQKSKSGKIPGFASEKGSQLATCGYGLKVLEGVRVTPSQLESMRKVMLNLLGRYMNVNFRVFAHKVISKKAIAVRMGGGKGGPDHNVAIVKAGHILFEIDGEKSSSEIRNALTVAAKKLGCKTKIIENGVFL